MNIVIPGQPFSITPNEIHVMGILNVTPDSFSDGGCFNNTDKALFQTEKMISEGASIIDIGGESTRPGAADVLVDEEISRTIPVIEAIKRNFDIAVSIDTSKAEVMAQAIDVGVDLINDVRALQEDNCLAVVAESTVPVCLMHMQGQPRTMQSNPSYDHVIEDVCQFFERRILACEQAGLSKERIILDPGFGFGKTVEQNYQLLAHLNSFKRLGLPILSGTSRKSMIGKFLNRDVQDRLSGSITTAILAIQNGASIVRVHDVRETVDAIKIIKYTHHVGDIIANEK